MKKRVLLLIALGVMCVAILGVLIFASSAASNNYSVTVDGATYYIHNGEAELQTAPSASDHFNIPAEIQGCPVTTIAYYAFENCTYLNSIEIPSTVTTIGGDAFKGCTNLTTVYITDISAWCNIYFMSNEYSNPLSHADKLYLNGALITSLVLPEDITSIGQYAFYNYDELIEVKISASVTSIGWQAFYHCDNLLSVTFAENSMLSSLGGGAFGSCTHLASLTLPGGVVSIGDYAFRDCVALGGFSVPGGVTSIGYNTFSGCVGLTSVTLHDGVTRIGNFAFSGCTGLTSISIPESVTSIGSCAFTGCTSLTEVHITDLAAWCRLEFDGAANNPISFARNLYLNGDLVSDLVIPEEITEIGDYAFYGCESITSVEIPETLTEIGNSAFEGCYNLVSVTLPERVTKIGSYAFSFCNDLATVFYSGSEIQYRKIAFGNSSADPTWCYADLVCQKVGYIFLDADGITVLKEKETADYGTLITPPDDPSRAATAQYTYTFIGFEGFSEGMLLTESEIFVAQYATVLNQYTYTFYDADGVKILKSETADYGTVITPPDIPSRPATPQYTYTFLEFEGYTDGEVLTENVSFKALFGTSINQYTYTFFDEDGTTVIKAETVDYGSVIVITEVSAKSEDGKHFVRLLYWDGYVEGMTVTENCFFKAVYDEQLQTWCLACGGENTQEADCPDCTDGYSYASCWLCGGSGKYGAAEWTPCAICDSTGRIQDTFGNWTVCLCGGDGGAMVKPDCTVCGGAGKFRDTRCASCNGSSKIELPNTCKNCEGKGYYPTAFIFYNANGGAFALEKEEWNGYEHKLNAQIPTKDRCVFYGWNTLSDSNAVYLPGNNYTGGDITFYAMWLPACAECGGAGGFEENSTCTGCGGVGLRTHETRYCNSCRSTSIRCVMTGTGEYYWCIACGSLDTATRTYTYDCDYCESGVATSTTSCVACEGKGYDMPTAPVITSFSSSTVTLLEISGFEYSLDGIHWQKRNAFEGLAPGTAYTFYQRFAATDTLPFGVCSVAAYQMTDRAEETAVPKAPTLEAVTESTVTLGTVDGCEYSMDGIHWQSSPLFEGLSVATEYTFYQRYKETATHYVSASSAPAVFKTDKGLPVAPAAPQAEHVSNTVIVLTPMIGYEYSKDGVLWQSGNVFVGLSPSTNYIFYQRLAENEKYYASPRSDSAVIKTASEAVKFTYTFVDEDGITIFKQATVDYGTAIVAPDVPVKQGGIFEGWSGYTEGMTVTGDTVIMAIWHMHSGGAFVVENRVDPTCTENGRYDRVVYCSSCNDELSREEKIIDMLGHDEKHHAVQVPTCLDIGWDAYVTCSRCDYTTYAEKSATGHSYEKSESLKWAVYTCPICGDTYREELVFRPVKLSTTTFSTAWGMEFVTRLVLGENVKAGEKVILFVDTEKAIFLSALSELAAVEMSEDGYLVLTTKEAMESDTVLADLTFRSSDFLTTGVHDFLSTVEAAEAVFAPIVICEMGDVNMDGKVNSRDVVLIKQHVVKMITLTDVQLAYADTQADSTLNARDAVLVQQVIVKMPATLGDRNNVTFVISETEKKTYTVREGSNFTAVPEVPPGCLWSESAETYVIPTFEAILTDMKYYLVKEDG